MTITMEGRNGTRAKWEQSWSAVAPAPNNKLEYPSNQGPTNQAIEHGMENISVPTSLSELAVPPGSGSHPGVDMPVMDAKKLSRGDGGLLLNLTQDEDQANEFIGDDASSTSSSRRPQDSSSSPQESSQGQTSGPSPGGDNNVVDEKAEETSHPHLHQHQDRRLKASFWMIDDSSNSSSFQSLMGYPQDRDYRMGSLSRIPDFSSRPDVMNMWGVEVLLLAPKSVLEVQVLIKWGSRTVWKKLIKRPQGKGFDAMFRTWTLKMDRSFRSQQEMSIMYETLIDPPYERSYRPLDNLLFAKIQNQLAHAMGDSVLEQKHSATYMLQPNFHINVCDDAGEIIESGRYNLTQWLAILTMMITCVNQLNVQDIIYQYFIHIPKPLVKVLSSHEHLPSESLKQVGQWALEIQDTFDRRLRTSSDESPNEALYAKLGLLFLSLINFMVEFQNLPRHEVKERDLAEVFEGMIVLLDNFLKEMTTAIQVLDQRAEAIFRRGMHGLVRCVSPFSFQWMNFLDVFAHFDPSLHFILGWSPFQFKDIDRELQKAEDNYLKALHQLYESKLFNHSVERLIASRSALKAAPTTRAFFRGLEFLNSRRWLCTGLSEDTAEEHALLVSDALHECLTKIIEQQEDVGSGRATLQRQLDLALQVEPTSVESFLALNYREHINNIFQEILYLEGNALSALISESLFSFTKSRSYVTDTVLRLISSPHTFKPPLLACEVRLITTLAMTPTSKLYTSGRNAMSYLASQEVLNIKASGSTLEYEEVLRVWILGAAKRNVTDGVGTPIYLPPISFLEALEELLAKGLKPRSTNSLSEIAMNMAVGHCPGLPAFLHDSKKIGPSKSKVLQDHYVRAAVSMMESEFNGVTMSQLDELCSTSLGAICQRTSQGTLHIQHQIGERLCCGLLDTLMKKNLFLKQNLQHDPIETIAGSKLAKQLMQIEKCPSSVKEHEIYSQVHGACMVLGRELGSGNVTLGLINSSLDTGHWEKIFHTLGQVSIVTAVLESHEELKVYKKRLKGFEVIIQSICPFLYENDIITHEYMKWKEWLENRSSKWEGFTIAEINSSPDHWPIEAHKSLYKYLDPIVNLHQSRIFLNLLLELVPSNNLDSFSYVELRETTMEEDMKQRVSFSSLVSSMMPQAVDQYEEDMILYVGGDVDFERIMMERMCTLLNRVVPSAVEIEFDLARRQLGLKDTKAQNILKRISDSEPKILDYLNSWKGINATREILMVLPIVANVFDFNEDCNGLVPQIWNVVTECTPICSLQNFHDVLESDGRTVLKLFSAPEVDILRALATSGPLIAFLKESEQEDLRVLIDAVEDPNANQTWEGLINDLIDLQRIFRPLLSAKTPSFEDLRAAVLGELKSSSSSSYQLCRKLEVCNKEAHSLRQYFLGVANRMYKDNDQICQVLKNGTYHFSINNDVCSLELKCWDENRSISETEEVLADAPISSQGYTSYTLVQLQELRSRARWTISSNTFVKNSKTAQALDWSNTEQKNIETTEENAKEFIRLINVAEQLVSFLTELFKCGHFGYATFEKEVSGFSGLHILTDYVRSELVIWKSVLDRARKECPCLNYFRSVELRLILEALTRGTSPESSKRLQHCLNLIKWTGLKHYKASMFRAAKAYASDVGLPACVEELSKSKKEDREYLLTSCLQLLSKVIESSIFRLKEEPDFELKSNERVREQGLTLALVDDPHHELDVVATLFHKRGLSLYCNASHVVLCSPLTVWEELYLLILRCFNNQQSCKDHFYCIIYVERLSFECQSQLLTFLQEVAREHHIGVTGKEAENELALVSCTQSKSLHTLSQHLQVPVCHMAAERADVILEQMAENCSEMWVVTSDLPGMGKTASVRRISQSNPDICIQTLCISGEVTRDLLILRLKDLNLQRTTEFSSTILHLDISIVDNPEILNVLLFELLILGCLKSDQAGVFHLNTEKVAIEVANTYQDQLALKLPVCNRFRKEHLVWDIAAFEASTKENGDDQLVCNYLIQMEAKNLDTWNPDFKGEGRNTVLLSRKDCQDLLQRHFVKDSRLMSFTLLQTFIKFFARQLRELSESPYFVPENLRFMHAMPSTRSSLVVSMLELSCDLSTRSVKPWLDEQLDPSMSSNTEVSMASRLDKMVRWSDNEHAMIFFQMGGPIIVLYRNPSHIPGSLVKLFHQQKTKLLDYEALTSKELHAKLWPILQRSEPPFRTTYVLTADNLLKMSLIFLKVKASVPVVIMGETGCGKTSLLRELARYCGVTFLNITLHAGTTEDTIRKFLVSAEEQASKEMVWAFLDEINACDHLGLLVGVVCHSVLDGKPLNQNLKILAACNPYRKHDSKKQRAGLSARELLKSGNVQHLDMAYTVHILPEALVDHVYDFGILNTKDERSYIHAMVLASKMGNVISSLFIELLVESQAFVRKKHGEASVSLRDASRCIALYNWFCSDLDNRVFMKERNSKTTPAKTKEKRAALLAFAHCYYYRLATDEERTHYRAKYAAILTGRKSGLWSKLKSKEKLFTADKFEEELRMEQMDLLERMEIPPGIAKNQALRENIFVTLVCILLKIPLFVVGKPGSGKTLSLQLIFSNLRGSGMKDTYFKQLPTMFMFSFQGSESSTSDGILKVFEKAHRCVEDNKKKNVQAVVVVVLDEVGLAEISRHNPLKVLHSLLEPDGERQVAVVGISNWSLDAAKMNRAIHISQPDPSELDLVATGKAILDSYGMRKVYDTKMTELEHLAKAYHEYHVCQSKPDFHGLRDYYSLIKSLRGDQNNLKVWSHGELERAVWRNFGGSPEDVRLLTSILHAHFKTLQLEVPHALDLVRANLNDKDARHLMLITTGDSAIRILEHVLPLEEKLIIIHGSKYRDDCSDDYAYLILSNIILHMEGGRHILLKGVERIWSSLYDMLNQHFTYVGGRRNCRIAIGAFSNPMCYVHDNFRCIVVVDQNEVLRLDPPFLNRFEKQVLTYDHMLTNPQREVMKNLKTWVKSMACVSGNGSSVEDESFCENDLFAGYSVDTLASIVLLHCNKQSIYKDTLELESLCKKDLIQTAYVDGMVRAHYSKALLKEGTDGALWTTKYLNEHKYQQSLKDVISEHIGEKAAWQDEMGCKVVITTRSNVHTDIRFLLKDLQYLTIRIIKLGDFTAERQMQTSIQQWSKSDANLLIIQADAILDRDHIPLAKVHVEQNRADCFIQGPDIMRSKHVVFLVHSHRGDQETQSVFSFLSGWKQITLDQLQQEDLDFRECLDKGIAELVQLKRFHEGQDLMVKVLRWSFLCIKYPCDKNSASYCQDMVQKICEDKALYECFIQRAVIWLEKHTEKVWQTDVVCNRGRLALALNLNYAFLQYIEEKLREPVARLVYVLERASALESYFNMTPDRKTLWRRIFMDELTVGIDNVPQPMHPEGYTIKDPINLCLPFSHIYAQVLDENFQQLYLSQLAVLHLDEASTLSLSQGMAKDISALLQKNPSLQLIGECVNAHAEEYLHDFAKLYAPYQSDERTVSEALVFEWLLMEKVPRPIPSMLHAYVWTKLKNLVAQALLAGSCFTADQISTKMAIIKRTRALTEDFDKDFALKCVMHLLPSQEVIEKVGGLEKWLHRFDILVRLVSCVEGPNHWSMMLTLHVLQDFARLVVCPLGLPTESLSSLSKWFIQERLEPSPESLIGKMTIFLPDINLLKGLPQKSYFRFIASYFQRLFESRILTLNIISTMANVLFSYTRPTCLMKSIMVQLLDTSLQFLSLNPAPKCPPYLQFFFVNDRKFVKEQVWTSKSWEPFVLLGDVIYEAVRGAITSELLSGLDTEECTYADFLSCLINMTEELTKPSGSLNLHAACSFALIRTITDVLAQDLLTVYKKEPGIFCPCLEPKVVEIFTKFFEQSHHNVLASKQYVMKVLRFHCGLSIQALSHLSLECAKRKPLKLYSLILDWGMLKEVDNPLGFNPYKSLFSGYEKAEELIWNLTYTKDEKLDDLKWKVKTSSLTEQGALVSAIASMLFLVQASRDLNEHEEVITAWLLDETSLQPWQSKWQLAIQCLCGSGPLQLSPVVTSPEILWFKALAAHVLLVVTSLPSSCPLQSYLVQKKDDFANKYVLSVPDNLLASIRGALLSKERLGEYKHSCGYTYVIGNCTRPNQKAKCPNCGGVIGGENHTLTSGNTQVTEIRCEKGYIVDIVGRTDLYYTVRGLDMKAYRALRVIVHYCILLSFYLGQSLEMFAKVLNIPDSAVVKEVETMINEDLLKLCELLNCNHEVACQYMHSVVASLANNLPVQDLSTPEARTSWEKTFEQMVKSLSVKNVHEEAQKYLDSHRGKHELTDLLEERRIPPFPVATVAFMRITVMPSLKNFKAAYLQDSQRRKDIPLIEIFFRHEKSLSEMKYLMGLVRFSKAVHEHFWSKITRPEAVSITIAELRTHEDMKKIVEDNFEDFANSWNKMRYKVTAFECTGFKKPIPEMTDDSPLGMCLVESRDLGIYLAAFFEHLRNIQNAFLDDVSAIGGFPHNHLGSASGGPPSVRIDMCKTEEVIDFEENWAEAVVCDAAMADLQYGQGLNPLYDDYTIDLHLQNHFLYGKSRLNASDDFLYKHEAFHKHMTIISDVENLINQIPLRPETMQGIQSEIDLLGIGSGRILAMLDLCLGFLRRTGGDPTERLGNYCQRWLGKDSLLFTSMPIFDSVQLQHLVSLYEGLEDSASLGIQALVNSRYRIPLEQEMVNELKTSVEVKSAWSNRADTGKEPKISAELFRSMLRRFMFRYLIGDHLNADVPLSIFITDDTLMRWPQDVVDEVDDIFPSSLLLKHSHATYLYLSEMLKTRSANL